MSGFSAVARWTLDPGGFIRCTLFLPGPWTAEVKVR